MKNVLVPLADGFEELEATTIIDILNRAGANVTIAAIGSLEVEGTHNISILAETSISDCTNKIYDLIALPGGMPGATNLFESIDLKQLLLKQNAENRYLAAICASPAIVFQPHGLLKKKKATCYPAFAKQLEHFERKNVVRDGNVITSQGPGTAIEFSLKLVEVLFGEKKVLELKQAMLIN